MTESTVPDVRISVDETAKNEIGLLSKHVPQSLIPDFMCNRVVDNVTNWRDKISLVSQGKHECGNGLSYWYRIVCGAIDTVYVW